MAWVLIRHGVLVTRLFKYTTRKTALLTKFVGLETPEKYNIVPIQQCINIT